MSEDNKKIFSNRGPKLKDKINKEEPPIEEKEFIEKDEVIQDIENEDTSPSIPQESLLDSLSNQSNINIEDENSQEIGIEDDEDVGFDDLEFEDASDEAQISIEDDEDNEPEEDNTIMNDMLSELDSALTEQNQEEANKLLEEIDKEDEPQEETFNDFYTDEELHKTKQKNILNKDLFIKIGVGACAIVAITIIAVLISKGINKDLNPSNNNSTSSETVATPIPKTSNTVNNITDDILTDIDNSSETNMEETPTIDDSTTTDTEDDSIFKTYKGYVIDIKDDSIYIADLTYDKFQALTEAYDEFKKVDPTTVDVSVNEEDKTYHIFGCEDLADIDTQSVMTLKEAIEKEYKQADCAKGIDIDTSKNSKDFDYSQYDDLNGVIYKAMAISDSSNINVPNLEIGQEVSAVYIQDSESLLNELIELKEATSSSLSSSLNNNSTDDTSNEATTKDTVQSIIKEGTNFWGEEWNAIVATINDRRKSEEAEYVVNDDGTITLAPLEKYESVSTTIDIGAASVVWFKISWKKNANVTSVPDAEDITCELLTPNGTLIGKDNIDKYGKMWIDEGTGLLNIVIRNTIAGSWEVVFTKDVGTYLGDVTIKAIPITGFLELKAADAVYSNGRLEVIWNAEGVADDNCIVEVYAVNGSKKVLMYSANSIDDGIHTVDMASIDTTKIAGNTYDIVIRVTDIDVSANKPHSIVAQYLSDTVTIENVEIPEQRVKTNVTASSTVGTQRQDATTSQSVNTSSSTTESIEVEETSTENDTN